MSKKKRQSVLSELEESVLLKSRRRCCLCFASGNDQVRSGTVAHIQTNAESKLDDNLVFLCVEHHSELDRGMVQIEELRDARTRLYQQNSQSDDLLLVSHVQPWQAYEDLVRTILIPELKKQGCIGVFSDKSYPSRSGRSREIDLSAEFQLACFRFLIVIQTKYAKRKIGVQDLVPFVSTVQDVGANKGIFVSNTGFSEAASRFGKMHGLGLLQIDENAEALQDGVLID